MIRLSNISIGIKLAVMSGFGVLLVAGMLFIQLKTDASVQRASETAELQQGIAHDLEASRAAIRGMQIANRDIRLARTSEELQKATRQLEEHWKAAHQWLDPLQEKFRIAENAARARKIGELIDNYAAGGKETAAANGEALALAAKDNQTADIALRIAALKDKIIRIERDRTLALVTEMEGLFARATERASSIAKQESNRAKQELASAERLGVTIGGMVIVLLIGSAVFGTMTISRPLAKMAGVLVELTNDRIVDVPYTGRGDEIGDIAKATELFKESIAQKVINLRVRSGLDVVRSNMMIADDQHNIMYTNHALNEMLKEVESDLRTVLPNFDVSKLVGANIDVFHKDPAHQRQILDRLTGSYEAKIKIGTQKFHLIATAVMDGHGKRAGTVVEWRNITGREAIEAEVDNIVKAAAAGDFSQRVPLEGKKDFMLNLATAMNSLCANTGAALDDFARMMSAFAKGDLTQRIGADYQGMFGKLKTDANAMADRLSATIGEIKGSAREVTNASAEISTSTTDLSQRTEEQAASLEETSASMEEIASTVKRNAENAQAANQSAAETREVADRGGQVVAKAVEAMARIEDSSRKISDIIGVIDEIARQTNLLALNAAVEAARAGDAGRGFAVVASEVRSLAQRSSQAAKDIKDLITNSNGQVKDGVELVNRAGGALTEIVESIKKVAGIVSDIATASIEQSTGIEQINKALTQMDEVTQQNSALVEENAATAKTLETQAQAMNEQVAFFRLDEGTTAVRSASAAREPRASAPAAAPAPASKVVTPIAKPAAAPARAAAARRGPVAAMHSKLATALQDPEWKDF